MVRPKIKVCQDWDDSLTTDIPLIKLLKKHNAKATFNIIPNKTRNRFYVKKKNDKTGTLFSFGAKEGFAVEHLALDELPELYKGFKVAGHFGFDRSNTSPEGNQKRKEIVEKNIDDLRKRFGQHKIGYVYPGGRYNQIAMDAIRDAGFVYGRTTKTARAPLSLDEPMAQPASCHWNNRDFWKIYEESKKKGGIFYFWGHSCELGDDPILWEKLDKIYEKISADPEAEWVDVIDLFPDRYSEEKK